jgi:hypothetical protein
LPIKVTADAGLAASISQNTLTIRNDWASIAETSPPSLTNYSRLVYNETLGTYERISELTTFAGGTLTTALNEAAPVTLASASVVNIGAANANTITITGVTAITGFDTITAGAVRRLIFASALTLTHNGTSLILPTGADITTAAGDAFVFLSLGSGNWRCIDYQLASGAALALSIPDNSITSAKVADNAITPAKVNDGAITSAKVADNAITSAKVADNAITPAKLSSSALSIARTQNRVINGAMQHSQERGNALVDVTTGVAYVVDQWRALLSTTPGGTLRAQRVQSVTPAGALNRLRFTVQVADASIAAGDFYAISQPIEGSMVADALFGSASARTIIVRLGVSSSQAGTYTVALRNGASNRSWLGSITIAPGEINIDLVRTVVLTGDTTGTWLTDTGLGMDLSICLAAGSTFQGAAGWSAGNFLATSSQTNFMATGGATFELFDVGHYVDVNAVGIAPTYEVPRFDDDLRLCRRYWKNLRAAVQSSFSMTIVHDPQLVSVPAVSGGGAGFALTWNFTNSCGFSQTTAAQQDLVFNSRY